MVKKGPHAPFRSAAVPPAKPNLCHSPRGHDKGQTPCSFGQGLVITGKIPTGPVSGRPTGPFPPFRQMDSVPGRCHIRRDRGFIGTKDNDG